MDKLAERNRERVLDLLGERLAFEREGVRLYDTVVYKIASGKTDPGSAKMLDQLREHRNQEKEHEEWLEEQIRSLGGDAHAKTDRVTLVERESEGVARVVAEDLEATHLLHALLTAELTDNAGWQLLLELADEASDEDAKREFTKRLHEEEEHLVFASRAVARLARKEILGEDVQMPTAP